MASSKKGKWLKLYVAVDIESQEIVASTVTPPRTHDSQVFDELLPDKCKLVYADKAYNLSSLYETCSKRGTRLVAPPRCNARLGKAPENGRTESGRDELILLNDLLGDGWKCQLGYGKRSLVECAFSLLKENIWR